MWWLITFYYFEAGVLVENNILFTTDYYPYLTLMFNDYCKRKNIKCEYIDTSKISEEEVEFIYEKTEFIMKEQRKLVVKKWGTSLNVYKYEGKTPKVKKIKPRSSKRAKQEQEYIKHSRPEYLAKNPYCEIKHDGCTYNATQIHHKKGRIGDLLNDKEYFCATCDNCHRWAELNPKEAKEKGFSLSRYNKK